MPKKKTIKPRLISEEKLQPLIHEAERLGDKAELSFANLNQQPFYHAIVYYVMFTHLLDKMRKKLGGIDDDTASANAFFWYSVVFEYSHDIETGFNPLSGEPGMDNIEGAPSLYFTDKQYIALIEASQQYAAKHPLTRAQKSAARKARNW